MHCIAGIDVSKHHFDLALDPEGSVQRFGSDPAGRLRLVEVLQAARVDRVVIEATGGYERLLMAELAAAGLEVVRINPRQMRQFARSTGCLAKSDAIDARMISRYGHALKPTLRELPDAELIALRELLTRRTQLVEMRNAENARRQQVLDHDVQTSCNRILALLAQELELIDRQLAERFSEDADRAARSNVLLQESGVGPVTAQTLVIELPELGRVSRQKIAALAGLAPMNRDSGKKRGVRRICGGRASVRRVLYMATLVATRYHPKIRAHYLHLQSLGKCKKLALTACMRKLLVILNAKLRDHLTSVASPAGSLTATPHEERATT